MRRSFRISASLLAIALLLAAGATAARAAVIFASPDTSQPFSTTNHSIIGTAPNGGNVTLTQDIAHDPTAGPWHKNLINNTTGPNMGQIFSGSNVAVTETMTNLGLVPWNQWTETVVTRTTIGSPNDSPGFQFQQGSVFVSADYGAGFVPLTNGVHYTLTGTPAPGVGFDPNGWETVQITLLPGSQINPGNALQISQNLFEVFGDGNVWVSGEAAELAQFPAVPEPTSMMMLALPLALLARRRRIARRWS